MYTFLEILVRFSLLKLIGKYLTQIKEHPGIPAFKIGHLHLHVNLRFIFHQYPDIENPQFVILIFLTEYSRQKYRLTDCFRIFLKKRCNKSFSYLRIIHQTLKAKIHGRKHYKIIIISFIGFSCVVF